VIIVEDERDIADLIKHALERGGEIKADIVGTGAAALTAVNGDPPDLILLDLSLPLLDGLELFRILRHRPATATIPIIMLTARASEADRVTGIELGAEDYITKPFSPRELVARAKSAMRRAKGQAPPTGPAPYKGKHLFVDFDAISIRVDNAAVTLTRREFELLKFLIENRNRVISRDRLLERVWGFDLGDRTRVRSTCVSRLRGKLGAAGKQIETVIGMGYRFSDLAENWSLEALGTHHGGVNAHTVAVGAISPRLAPT
jgi:DNA-binding response OmpR family regulator